MTKRYPQVQGGDRVAPVMQGYKMACCDCGLVHTIDFEVVVQGPDKAGGMWAAKKPRNKKKLRVILTVHRDNRATAQLRRRQEASKP
jgi:hypothetical protein